MTDITPEKLVEEWLNKKVDVEIKTFEDEQLFTVILSQMLIDCYSDNNFKKWLNSDDRKDKLKAGMSLARPILVAYMYAKDNQKELRELKDEQSGQDIIKS